MLITHLKERGEVRESLLLNSTHDFVYLLYLKICLSAPAPRCSDCLCQRLSVILKEAEWGGSNVHPHLLQPHVGSFSPSLPSIAQVLLSVSTPFPLLLFAPVPNQLCFQEALKMSDHCVWDLGGNFPFGVYSLFVLLLHHWEVIIKINLFFSSLQKQ